MKICFEHAGAKKSVYSVELDNGTRPAVEFLRDLRRNNLDSGRNQQWLADQMGVSRARVSRLFNAPPNFTFESFARLAVALGLTPKVILDWNGFMATLPKSHLDAEDIATDQAIAARRYVYADTQATASYPYGEFANAAS